MKKINHLASALSVAGLLITLAPNVMAEAAAGKAVYDGKGACGACHGITGKGDSPAAAVLNPKPRSFAEGVFAYDTDSDGKPGTDADLFAIIKNGSAPYGGAATMPGRPDLSDDEIHALVAYVRALKN